MYHKFYIPIHILLIFKGIKQTLNSDEKTPSNKLSMLPTFLFLTLSLAQTQIVYVQHRTAFRNFTQMYPEIILISLLRKVNNLIKFNKQ